MSLITATGSCMTSRRTPRYVLVELDACKSCWFDDVPLKVALQSNTTCLHLKPLGVAQTDMLSDGRADLDLYHTQYIHAAKRVVKAVWSTEWCQCANVVKNWLLSPSRNTST